eukprot:gene22912-30091_t
MADHSDIIAEFCSITGAQTHVAEHFLESTGYALNQAVEFFLENPPDTGPAIQRSMSLEDDLPDAPGYPDHVTGPGPGLGPGSVHPMAGMFRDFEGPGHLTEEEQLRLAVAQSMGNNEDFDVEVIEDAENADHEQLAALAALRERAMAAAPMQETADDGALGGGRVHAGAGSSVMNDSDIPLGVEAHEVEEAKMLEAALLGIPYEGRIPDFSNRQPPAPIDPEAKKDAEAAEDRARREKEEAEAQLLREEQEAAEKEANKQAALEAALAKKAKSLSAEPASTEADVRMPDGSRQSRRFKKSEPLQSVFDYIDLQMKGEPFSPRTYSLVNSYPRKVFADGSPGSLADAGISTDTALFLEPSKEGTTALVPQASCTAPQRGNYSSGFLHYPSEGHYSSGISGFLYYPSKGHYSSGISGFLYCPSEGALQLRDLRLLVLPLLRDTTAQGYLASCTTPLRGTTALVPQASCTAPLRGNYSSGISGFLTTPLRGHCSSGISGFLYYPSKGHYSSGISGFLYCPSEGELKLRYLRLLVLPL